MRFPALHPQHARWPRLPGWRRLLSVLLPIVLLLQGCTGTLTGLGTRVEQPPSGLSREDLLNAIAACHLRRVAQNGERGVTDAVVIAGAERYGFRVGDVIDRANALMNDARDPAARERLRALAGTSCEELSALTGVVPTLVRFDAAGNMNNTWIVVSGEIKEGFADQVISRLREEKAVGVIISSPGGSLYEARRLGRHLRSNGLRVGVDGLCTSACVDVLAGGIERYVTARARLGIHQSAVPKHLSSHEGGQLSVVAAALYLREMGIDDGIALAAAAVPNDRMYWISVPEALETGLATAIVTEL